MLKSLFIEKINSLLNIFLLILISKIYKKLKILYNRLSKLILLEFLDVINNRISSIHM